MDRSKWEHTLLPVDTDDELWELFHENSKLTRYQSRLSDNEILLRMEALHYSFPYDEYEAFDLPSIPEQLGVQLDQAIIQRHTAREMQAGQLTVSTVGSLLHYAYGITRTNADESYPRPFAPLPQLVHYILLSCSSTARGSRTCPQAFFITIHSQTSYT